jgi:predicted kinase
VVAPGLGASPGAVILRTDEVRKRLLGIAPTEAPPDGTYTADAQARTYDVMIDNARTMLKAGRAVVLDATFIDPALRARVEALAAECGAPFHAAWLDAPVEVLEARVAGRTGDASDATVAVLHDQLQRMEGQALTWPKVSTEAPKEAAARAWLAKVATP